MTNGFFVEYISSQCFSVNILSLKQIYVLLIMEKIYFLKKDVLKNFANFTGKHLCWGVFLTKSPAFEEHV